MSLGSLELGKAAVFGAARNMNYPAFVFASRVSP
jgi:hypothetical protein